MSQAMDTFTLIIDNDQGAYLAAVDIVREYASEGPTIVGQELKAEFGPAEHDSIQDVLLGDFLADIDSRALGDYYLESFADTGELETDEEDEDDESDIPD